ncbi:uncharacterized protein LOC143910244 [Arctopsyche grandis]|uniref:uncharacterized protein LOC143910244 n=1 Tax=Arctopsyche grandis TaxID=121162 RepID=UPI00406D8D0A
MVTPYHPHSLQGHHLPPEAHPCSPFAVSFSGAALAQSKETSRHSVNASLSLRHPLLWLYWTRDVVTLRELSTLSTECNNTTVHKQTPVRCPYDVIAASSTVSPPPYSASTSLASALASASTPGQVAALSSTASPLPSSSSTTLTSASASTSDYVPVSCAPASASTVDPSNSFSQVAGTSSGRLPYTRGSGAPDKTLQVATIPKLKNVHVFNLANNCTCDTVKQFILNKIKNKRINVSQVAKTDMCSSFKISVDTETFNIIINPEFWPIGTGIREWLFLKKISSKPIAQTRDP